MLQASTRARALAALLVCASLAPSASARAWTETIVESFEALVDARGEGPAKVSIELGVRIKGGWLEGLELTGLDPDLIVSSEPRPVLRSEEGRPYYPRVETQGDGTIWLRFSRSRAPRRGRYVLELAYASPAAAPRSSGGQRRVEYTIPGFRNGLDGAQIEILAPEGARLPSDFRHSLKLRTSAESAPGGRRFVFRRVHLPRTMSFTASLDLPGAAGPVSVSEGRSFGSLPTNDPTGAPLPTPGAAAIALLLAAWSIAARAAHRRAARMRKVAPRSLLGPERALAHAALVLSAATGLALAFGSLPELALGLSLGILFVTIERLPVTTAPPRPGRFVPAHARMMRDARAKTRGLWLEPIALLDPLRPLGAALLGAAAIAVWTLDASSPIDEDVFFTPLHGLFVLAALALSFGRSRVPRTPEERLVDVFREARRLTLPLSSEAPLAISLAAHVDHDGALQDARIRVHTEKRPNGLIRLDVSSVDRAGLGGFSPEGVLIVVTRLGSEAELAVSRAFPDAAYQDAPGSRRARVLRLGGTHAPLIRAIATTETAPSRPKERLERLSPRLA